jgi:hypothetical protein
VKGSHSGFHHATSLLASFSSGPLLQGCASSRVPRPPTMRSPPGFIMQIPCTLQYPCHTRISLVQGNSERPRYCKTWHWASCAKKRLCLRRYVHGALVSHRQLQTPLFPNNLHSNRVQNPAHSDVYASLGGTTLLVFISCVTISLFALKEASLSAQDSNAVVIA